MKITWEIMLMFISLLFAYLGNFLKVLYGSIKIIIFAKKIKLNR